MFLVTTVTEYMIIVKIPQSLIYITFGDKN
jgi:hypothetical protein